jgi:hypothetical protein
VSTLLVLLHSLNTLCHLLLQSFQLNPSLSYSNPNATLNHELAIARDRERYHDTYGIYPSTSVTSTAINIEGSGNGVLGGGMERIQATPMEGLSCPQCRFKPIVDAVPSLVLKSLVHTLTKVSSSLHGFRCINWR